ncbi:MAG: alpha/beta hydrolase [Halobacteriales archaeon]|nr:alpha/beta hydrolase [Halobacteriales archaeon]
MEREDSDFTSEDVRCSGWLYRPDDEDDETPVVVMAHGFGGERSFRLPAYAERFAERSMAAFVFDYRSFGDSEGEPRQLISPKRHVQDWLSAVEHVESLGYDGIALWGSSFSGGHVVATAARTDAEISALVAQVPFTDGQANTLHLVRKKGLGYGVRAVVSGLRDQTRRLTGRAPYYVPITNDPGKFGVLNTPGAKEGFEAIVPEGHEMDNRCPARILVTVGTYRPIKEASKVDCPAFVMKAENDLVVPTKPIEKLIERLDADALRLECGHFDPYLGETFERVVEEEADFLEDRLL